MDQHPLCNRFTASCESTRTYCNTNTLRSHTHTQTYAHIPPEKQTLASSWIGQPVTYDKRKRELARVCTM